ncbi:Fc.00g083510.m01.CDS01 [Cosmosporella sp. VM-42]
MPRPATAIPDFLQPLYLYRHLLRECSYLPPAWRENIAQTIRGRFRRHRKDPRAKAHCAGAFNTLRGLRAANSGDKLVMEGLIQKGFGRRGPRRRRLLDPFLRSQGPGDSDALDALLDGTTTKDISRPVKSESATSMKDDTQPKPDDVTPIVVKPPRIPFFENWDQPKLKQFLKAQRTAEKQTEKFWIKGEIKSLDETQFVPKTNFWGKPPVKSLVSTKIGKWWHMNVKKMMAPLSKGEWDLLAKLADGAQELKEWKVPERRTPAILLAEDQKSVPSSLDWNWEDYATKPAALIERSKTRQGALRSGQQPQGPYQSQQTTKEITPRWYKRAYNRAWLISPLVEQDQSSLKYSFEWGSLKDKISAPSKSQLDVFEGVDQKGKKLAK